MEAKFWHERWQTNQIAFHLDVPNPFLVKNLTRLQIPTGSRIFLPLCGKSVDIPWLLSQGFRVAGAELSQIAVDQLFVDLGHKPHVTQLGEVARYSAPGIDIFVGDIFRLSRAALGPVDAVYDRAALVALPEDMRARYSAHLVDIADNAPQLLVTYHYDQTQLPGPPFSVSADEVMRRYQNGYEIDKISTTDVEGGLKGKCPATETVWHLKRKR